MKTVYLYRPGSTSTAKFTFGHFLIEYEHLYTLELPWRDNQPNISCIPCGEYPCEYKLKKDKEVYEVHNVPNRIGIQIEVANYVDQLRGCIAIGTRVVYPSMVQESHLALKQLKRLCGEKFLLNVNVIS